MSYTPPVKYTPEEQFSAVIDDLQRDIQHAEDQATHGPWFPDTDITPDTLRAYAQHCREQIARLTASPAEPLAVVNAFIAGKI